MSTDDPRPEILSAANIAEDLSLSNEEGTSWFGYDFDHERNILLVELYGDEGEILKRFDVAMTITEVDA